MISLLFTGNLLFISLRQGVRTPVFCKINLRFVEDSVQIKMLASVSTRETIIFLQQQKHLNFHNFLTSFLLHSSHLCFSYLTVCKHS